MWPRRLVALLGLLTLLGCSGMTSLVVINNLGEDATVSVRSYGTRVHDEELTLQMAHGDRKDSVAWYGGAPLKIDLEVKTAKEEIKKTFRASEFPPAMARGTYGSGQYILELRSSGPIIRQPSTMDNFIRNPATVLLPLGCFSCVGVTVFLVIWMIRRSRPKPQ